VRNPVRAPFPLGRPTWPNSVPRPPVEKRTGVHYETEWARRYPARLARALIVDDVLRPMVHLLGSPTVYGADRLADVDGAAIFAANHHSHLDTGLLLSSLPDRFRHKAVVAAAADYFFTTRGKSAFSALAMGAIPIERLKVNRRSADLAADLLDEGWSVVIFPEGGRSVDGWGRKFQGGAAYLSLRCDRPIVPVHVEGTRRVMKKGDSYPRPVGGPFGRGKGVQVRFGAPIKGREGEDARRLAARIESVVATLADEGATDWWSAQRRAAAGTTPSLAGPQAGAWRRSWALEENRRRSSSAGKRWPEGAYGRRR
jgi:1-acyl-sn-glycerol-3-phosphate acyltransferase